VISLIVPARGESRDWWQSVSPASADFDLVVVDGGGNPEAPPDFPGRVLLLPGSSRGARLDAGARAARGDVLFFLHGDSRPPATARRLIEEAVEAGAPAGCFLLAYTDETPALRRLAWWANLRTRWLRLPFGDQGMFCTRAAYEKVGGFADLAICDDVDFARKIGRLRGFRVMAAACRTSPRRYRRGTLRRVLINVRVLAGFFLGVGNETLERWYRG